LVKIIVYRGTGVVKIAFLQTCKTGVLSAKIWGLERQKTDIMSGRN